VNGLTDHPEGLGAKQSLLGGERHLPLFQRARSPVDASRSPCTSWNCSDGVLAGRRVHFAGCTTSPNELWMKQIARNLTDSTEGFLLEKRVLLLDRDTKYCESFVEILNQEGIQCLRLPPQSPNLNAHLERFIRSIKEECLERMIFFGEQSLRTAVSAYMQHYHSEGNHQGLGNKLIQPSDEVGQIAGRIKSRERLGGMLKYYYRSVA
jgi:putative transposase